MSKFVGTGPSTYEKRIYRAAVSQRLRNTDIGYNINIVTFRCTRRSSYNANLSTVMYVV